MRLAVFGGTGRTGRLVIEQALAGGHDVQAFVRDAARLSLQHDRLRVFEGLLDDGRTAAATLAGTDAVISALSAGYGTLTRFGAAVLPVMKLDGPRRIVALAGASLRLPGDPDAFSLRLMSVAMRMIPGRMLEDAGALASQLVASRLDWTLVRSANFTDAPGTGRIRSAPGYAMSARASIPRADVARFLLSCATSGEFTRAAPMIEAG